ncbi:MAG: hypothetical protein HOL04_08065 [Gammaproteobacteria bacterium]|jgi:hypothetical protein|nr:hypothetical protein [Gammaproteobacteria bacterium]MBT4608207.1 hypothetical protein [Thiotrichales bacterium]MBT3472211.1 hypothetical protein [Gammaproteobacteria bacterium]MBT3966009.1 hypothetical protein [Gammaproteobacteria bacterium]MBT4079932.1 hypothetical protein [Gammaproteobacteria bacterium]
MERLNYIVEWLDREWFRFLVWFLVGLFVIPMGITLLTGAVKLDRFYDGLMPGQLNIGVLLLAMAPYLLYLGYRIVRHMRGGEGEIEVF